MKYYVNKNQQSNGDHEVHNLGCVHCPYPENRIYLGNFSRCTPAVRKAGEHYNQVNGCYYCSRDCHTG